MAVEPIVTTQWLAEHLNDPRVVVVDIRGYVITRETEPGVEQAIYQHAHNEYLEGHIPGARYVDWTWDIIDPDDTVPVQIAPAARFAEAMASRGVGDGTHVIAVDHKGGQFATRLWWALRYFGHDAVSVLEGGFKRWVDEGRAIETRVSTVPRGKFTPRVRSQMRVTAEQVLGLVGDGETQLIDARDEAQFLGRKRRGPRGGHIPGAINLPRERFFDGSGAFLSLAELKEVVHAAGLRKDRPVVAYCNGGVAATVALFNLHRLGFDRVANYDGSWNEWGARPELPARDGGIAEGS